MLDTARRLAAFVGVSVRTGYDAQPLDAFVAGASAVSPSAAFELTAEPHYVFVEADGRLSVSIYDGVGPTRILVTTSVVVAATCVLPLCLPQVSWLSVFLLLPAIFIFAYIRWLSRGEARPARLHADAEGFRLDFGRVSGTVPFRDITSIGHTREAMLSPLDSHEVLAGSYFVIHTPSRQIRIGAPQGVLERLEQWARAAARRP